MDHVSLTSQFTGTVVTMGRMDYGKSKKYHERGPRDLGPTTGYLLTVTYTPPDDDCLTFPRFRPRNWVEIILLDLLKPL